MKRNRFFEMVPPTPEDFHASVLDALRRLPAQQRKRRPDAMRIAACIAAVFAVGAAVIFPLRMRLSTEDRVASPNGEMLTASTSEEDEKLRLDFALRAGASTEDRVASPNGEMLIASATKEDEKLRLEIGDWRADASGVSVNWSIEGPSDETLLVYSGGELTPGDGEYFTDLMEMYYALLGQEVLGSSNGAEFECSEWMGWGNSVKPAQLKLTARIYVYRPTAEFIDDRDQRPESFEGVPKWLIAQYEDYVGAQPIDYYGRYDFQTPFGCDRMDSVQSAISGEYFESGASLSLADRMELERILLETLGYAELVKGYEVTIDMSAGSGSGATELREIDPR